MSELLALDTLTFSTPLCPSVDIGARGDLKWIDLTQLYVDPAYQRAILDSGRANIRRMVEGFSWLQFGVLVVGVRSNGRFAIIDGQHRATAAKLHGRIKQVPCLVLAGGQKDEARAFSSINGNVTRIHPLQSFRAKVAAGDSEAVALIEVCGRGGVTLAPYPKPDLAPGETMALGAVRVVIKRSGPALFVATGKLLRAADPDGGLSASAILGTAHAIAERPNWRRDAAALGRSVAERGGGVETLRKRHQAKGTARRQRVEQFRGTSDRHALHDRAPGPAPAQETHGR